MSTDIAEIAQAAKAPINQVFFNLSNDILSKRPDQPPFPLKLYHYTSSAGLLGILGKHKLWFSDNAFMNDGSEIRYGIELLRTVVLDFMADKSEAERDVADELLRIIAEQNYFHRTIIFCMSREGNLLNQWRDYGKGVTSYSVEFEASELVARDAFTFRAHLFPVIYDQEAQFAITRQFVEELYKRAKTFDGQELTDIDRHSLLMAAGAESTFLIGRFKNPAFAAEQEWRLTGYVPLDSRDPLTQFRTSALGIVPYYEWGRRGGEPLPITRLIVGPTPYADASHAALVQFALRSGYGNCEMSYSTIPIRRT
jgi:hypothetical protein